jgi:predicted metal-binding protein
LFFSVHHIYITYGAPACTTCLFILNLSKNSHFRFAIVSESGCKGKRFYRNHQMFSKVFFEKVFFSKLP